MLLTLLTLLTQLTMLLVAVGVLMLLVSFLVLVMVTVQWLYRQSLISPCFGQHKAVCMVRGC
jgi:hypothetical protein